MCTKRLAQKLKSFAQKGARIRDLRPILALVLAAKNNVVGQNLDPSLRSRPRLRVSPCGNGEICSSSNFHATSAWFSGV